ncbi:MAG: hypothetical protein QMD82_03655 [bacterium]|nr:hypothetical protein [bacterium]
MENFESFLHFSFFDFLRELAFLFTNGFKPHLLYIEFPLIGTIELLDSLAKNYPFSEREALFIFSNSSLLVLTPEPGPFLKHLKQKEIYKKFLKGKLNIVTLYLRKFEHHPANILRRLYEKAQQEKRHLHIPNIESYKKLAELISRGDEEIFVDLPEENPFFSTETLQIITGSKIAFIKGDKINFLRLKEGTKIKTIKLISDNDSTIKIDTITVEDVHKTLQSYFITPNVNREILELLYYRSMKSFSKLFWLLNLLDSKNFFKWDENTGWVLNEGLAFPYENYYTEKSRRLFKSMGKEEKLITYLILSSAQPLDKTDIIKLFPKIKTQTIDKVITNLTDNRIIKVVKNKIYSFHPVIEFNTMLDLPERYVKEIHGNYAHLLHTKKMNGFPIALWEIARHFELSGDSRNAFKYYYEAINEEVKNKQYNKALQHAIKAKLLAKTKKQKSSIRETIVTIYTKMGEYVKALEFIKSMEEVENNHWRDKKREIELLTELGETKSAAKSLEDFLSTKKRFSKDLLLLRLKIDYNADRLEWNTELLLKKLESKNSSHNGKAEIFEVLGDCEFYRNRIKKATEYYLKALKASKKIEDITLLKLKLAEMLLLNFKFRGALNHLENVLWALGEVKNKHAREIILGEIGKIYLFLLPPRSYETFIKRSIDDILNTTPKTNYPFYFYSGLILIHSGLISEGYNLAMKGIEFEKQRGNIFRANQMSLILTQRLLKYNELNKARELLEGIRTKSEYIFARKRILEKLLEMLQNDSEINMEEVENLVSMNALNALIFFEATENIKKTEIDSIRCTLLNKYNDLKSALTEFDLMNHYSI